MWHLNIQTRCTLHNMTSYHNRYLKLSTEYCTAKQSTFSPFSCPHCFSEFHKFYFHKLHKTWPRKDRSSSRRQSNIYIIQSHGDIQTQYSMHMFFSAVLTSALINKVITELTKQYTTLSSSQCHEFHLSCISQTRLQYQDHGQWGLHYKAQNERLHWYANINFHISQ